MELASGWYHTHKAEGWNPRWEKGPLEESEAGRLHVDEFQDRRM